MEISSNWAYLLYIEHSGQMDKWTLPTYLTIILYIDEITNKQNI